jgi:putative hydrolase of the HAD superfamily
VLFDLDGTLTDRQGTLRAYARQFLLDFGAVFRLTEIAAVAAELVRLDDNGYNPRRSHDLAAHPAFTAAPSPEELESHRTFHFPRFTVARTGARETLAVLATRSIRMGIVTNGHTSAQQTKVDVLGIRPLMRTVLVSETEQVEKPDPRIFHTAAERLGLPPQRCMFVGDHPEKDVCGAEAAGMRAVWIPAELPWPADVAPAARAIKALPELLQLLHLRF